MKYDNSKINNDLAAALGLTLGCIKDARTDHEAGEGVTVIGITLGLDKHYADSEWDSVITDLHLFEEKPEPLTQTQILGILQIHMDYAETKANYGEYYALEGVQKTILRGSDAKQREFLTKRGKAVLNKAKKQG